MLEFHITTVFFAAVLACWGYALMRKFICLVLVLNPLSVGSTTVAIFLQFFLQLFLFWGTNQLPPMVITGVTLLINMLFFRILVKAKLYHLLLVSVIYSVLVLSVEMLVVLGLTWISKAHGLTGEFVFITSFLIRSLVLAPLAYLGLRKLSLLEGEIKTKIMRRVQIITTLFCVAVGMLGQYSITFVPGCLWARGIDVWFFPLVLMFLAFSMLAGSDFLHIQEMNRLKVMEHQALQQYIRDMERQSMEIQQFRHDYKNILLSLDSYIHQGDLKRLKEYFEAKIKNTSETMLNQQLISGEHYLINIRIEELKSILIIKMQEMTYKNIQIYFEAVEPIDRIALDIIVMVRILGILLDNAIEEVVNLARKEISIGIMKNEGDVIIVVSNTCRAGPVDIQNLSKRGFSNKGEGRGMGLYNLAEFTGRYDNLFIETKIENNRFIQIITIEGE